jgi:hypothetical protein
VKGRWELGKHAAATVAATNAAMGKQKKTRKFAEVKRLIKAKEAE